MFVLVWLLCSSADKLQKVWHTNFMLLYNKLIPFLTVNNKLHLFASQEQLQVFSKEFCNLGAKKLMIQKPYRLRVAAYLVPQAHSRTVRCYHYLHRGIMSQLGMILKHVLGSELTSGILHSSLSAGRGSSSKTSRTAPPSQPCLEYR